MAFLPPFAKGYAYEVELKPACAHPGELFTATLRLKPQYRANGAVMPFYADQSREEGKAAFAEPDGTLVYSWVARAVIGEGRLVTQAQDPDTGEFGTKVLAFYVVEVGTKC